MSLTRTIIFCIVGLFLILAAKSPFTNALSFENELDKNLKRTYPTNDSIMNNITFKEDGILKNPFHTKKDLPNFTSRPEEFSGSTAQKEYLESKIGNSIFKTHNHGQDSIAQNYEMGTLKRHRRRADTEERSLCKHRKTAKEGIKETRESSEPCSGKRKEHSRNAKKYKYKSDFDSDSQDKTSLSPPKPRKKIKNKKMNRPRPFPKDGPKKQMAYKNRPYKNKRPVGMGKSNKNRKKNQWQKQPSRKNNGEVREKSPHRTGTNTYSKSHISQPDKNLAVMKGSPKKNFKPSSLGLQTNTKDTRNRLKKHNTHAKDSKERMDHLHPELDKTKNLNLHKVVPSNAGMENFTKSKNKHISGDNNSFPRHDENKKVNIHKINHAGDTNLNKHQNKNHSLQKIDRDNSKVKNSSKINTGIKSPINGSDYNKSEIKNVEGITKHNVIAVQSENQTTKSPEIKTTKGSQKLHRNLVKKMKYRRKVGLHRNYHAKKSIKVNKTGTNIRKLRFLTGLGRSIRNANEDILNEIKDYLLKNFPTNKYKRTPETDGSDSKQNKTFLNQVKEFLVNNFQSSKTTSTTESTNLLQFDSNPTQRSIADTTTMHRNSDNVTSSDYDDGEDENGMETTEKDTENIRRHMKEQKDGGADDDFISSENKSPINSEIETTTDESTTEPYLNDEETEDFFRNERENAMNFESAAKYTSSWIKHSPDSAILEKRAFGNSKRDVGNSSVTSQPPFKNTGDSSSYNNSRLSKMDRTNAFKKPTEAISDKNTRIKEEILKEMFSSSTSSLVPTSSKNSAQSPIHSTSFSGFDHATSTKAIVESINKSKVLREVKDQQSDDYDYELTSTQTNFPSSGTLKGISSEFEIEETSSAYEIKTTVNSIERNERKNDEENESDDDLEAKNEYSPVILKPSYQRESMDSSDLDENEKEYDSEDTLEPSDSKTPKTTEIHRKDKNSHANSKSDNGKSKDSADFDKNYVAYEYEDLEDSNNSKKPKAIETDSDDKKTIVDSKSDNRKSKEFSNFKENGEDYNYEDTDDSSNFKRPKETDSEDKNSVLNSKTDNVKSKDSSYSEGNEDYGYEDTLHSRDSIKPETIETDTEDEILPANLKKSNKKSKDSSDFDESEDYNYEATFDSRNSRKSKAEQTGSKGKKPHVNYKIGHRKLTDSPELDKDDDEYEYENIQDSNNSKKPKSIESKDVNSLVYSETENRRSKDSSDFDKNDADYDYDTLDSRHSQKRKAEKIVRKDKKSALKSKKDHRKSPDSPDLDNDEEEYDYEDIQDSSNSKKPKSIESKDINSPVNSETDNRKSKDSSDFNKNDADYDYDTFDSKNSQKLNQEKIVSKYKKSAVNSKTGYGTSIDSDIGKNYEEYDYEDADDSRNSKRSKAIEMESKDINSPLDSETVNRRSKESSDFDKSDADYDHEDTRDSRNSIKSKSIKIGKKDKKLHVNPKAYNKKSKDSSDLRKNGKDYNSENTLVSESSKIPKAIETVSTHSSESKTSETPLHQDGNEENENSPLDRHNEYEYEEESELTSTAKSLKLKRKQKTKNSNKKVNNNLKQKTSSSSDMSKVGTTTAIDDNNLYSPEIDFTSDTTPTIVENNGLSENTDDTDYEASYEETPINEESVVGGIKSDTARSSNENSEKSSEINSTSLEAELIEEDGYEDGNVTHTVALKNVKIMPITTTSAYDKYRDSMKIPESRDTATRPRKEYDNANDTDEEYDYEIAETKLLPLTNPQSSEITTSNETISMDSSKILDKKDVQKDKVGAISEPNVSPSVSDASEKLPIDPQKNESDLLNMAKAHKDDEAELVPRSDTSSAAVSKSIQQKSISTYSMSDDSKDTSDLEKNNDKRKSIDILNMEEGDRKKIEDELLDSTDTSSSAGYEDVQLKGTSEPIQYDPEQNLDLEKGVDEKKVIPEAEPVSSKPHRPPEHNSGKTKNRRGEDKASSLQVLKKFLNSLIHSKIQERRNKNLDSTSHRRIRRTRDTLSVEQTTFAEVTTARTALQSAETSPAKGLLLGIGGLVIISSLTLGIYKLISERSGKNRIYDETINSDDLKQVFVEAGDGTSDLLSMDDDDAEVFNRWDNDQRHLLNVIHQVLQTSEIPYSETIKEEYSATSHTSKIHLVMNGT